MDKELIISMAKEFGCDDRKIISERDRKYVSYSHGLDLPWRLSFRPVTLKDEVPKFYFRSVNKDSSYYNHLVFDYHTGISFSKTVLNSSFGDEIPFRVTGSNYSSEEQLPYINNMKYLISFVCGTDQHLFPGVSDIGRIYVPKSIAFSMCIDVLLVACYHYDLFGSDLSELYSPVSYKGVSFKEIMFKPK